MASEATRYKEAAEKLWSLLDDIDTASDMFKPSTEEGFRAFYRYAMKRCEERGKILESRDGYTLVWPDTPDDGPGGLPLEPDGARPSRRRGRPKKDKIWAECPLGDPRLEEDLF